MMWQEVRSFCYGMWYNIFFVFVRSGTTVSILAFVFFGLQSAEDGFLSPVFRRLGTEVEFLGYVPRMKKLSFVRLGTVMDFIAFVPI